MKTILNIILILIAISSIVVAIVKSYPIESQFTSFATALACVGATLAKKTYRYIGRNSISSYDYFFFLADR